MSDGHDLFDSDDEDESPKVAVAKAPASTQVENDTGLKDFTTSIFGDDSDDDDDIFGAGKSAAISAKYNFDDDDEDEGNADLADSDDDADFGSKRKRLNKSKASGADSSAKKISKKGKLSMLAKGDRGDKGDGRIKKKLREKRLKRSDKPSMKDAGEDGAAKGDSGDEYDSGDEVVATEEDEKFIAGDDDLDYLVKEYDEEGQNFDDERPEKKKSKSKKSSGSGSGSGGGGGDNTGPPKEKDPLTLTMEMLKRPKQVAMSDNEKAQITTDLLNKMEIACRQDDDMYRRGQPAIYKLQLLPVVQKIVAMKTLHTTLLDYDILAAFKEWIEPRDAKTLPSLAVRTAVYEMLLRLPCQVDHLKRCAPGKLPIGATIVALRKHASETVENKKVLKEIMEKWCRPIFGKSTDPRSMSSGYENPEMREIAVMRLQQQRQEELNKMQASQGSGGSGSGGLNSLLGGTGDEKKNGGSSRARTPFSSGFLFTVQPEFKPLRGSSNEEGGGARVVREEGMDEERTKLLKVMKDTSRGGGSTVGVKTNPRAMNMSLNGRSK